VVLGSSLTEVRTDLAEVGVALLTGVSGPAALLELAEALGAVVPHRDSGPDGVTVIEDRGSAGGAWAGFSRMGLSPHTDRSGIASPPGLVLTVCGREPLTGGEALLVDGRAVYAHLAARDPDALAAFSIPRTALFGGGGGHLGAVFTTHASLTVIRLRLDALVRFAPALLDHLPALRRAIDAHTVAVALAAGHGYAINNRRWLHGRRAFTGPRALYRVTAEACTGMVPAGFHPPTDDETYHLTAHRQKTND
jgi:alpha-ketoglutarate-dependent taurine dioxygenase